MARKRWEYSFKPTEIIMCRRQTHRNLTEHRREIKICSKIGTEYRRLVSYNNNGKERRPNFIEYVHYLLEKSDGKYPG